MNKEVISVSGNEKKHKCVRFLEFTGFIAKENFETASCTGYP